MIEGGRIGEMGDEFACLISGLVMVAKTWPDWDECVYQQLAPTR
jgi:hypothetical protein